jgi:uncharacterized protein YlxW (UPF0749 family)
MADWTNPNVNVLTSSDALALQQIFRSISQEFARLNKEITDLKNATSSRDNSMTSKLR